jgi:hypothetical protein
MNVTGFWINVPGFQDYRETELFWKAASRNVRSKDYFGSGARFTSDIAPG